MPTPEQKAQNVRAFESVVKVAAFGETPIAPLSAWSSLAPVQPTGGYWYFSFICPTCQRASPLFRDFSDGNLGKPFVGFGVQATCHFCQRDIECPSEGIAPIQWPLEPGQVMPPSEYAARRPRQYTTDPEYRPLRGALHHYTSLDAFLSIVKSKALWATNIHYLNDTSESDLGLRIMRQMATEARKSATGADADFLAFFLDWLEARVFEAASVYVLCFSEAHNQLSQWRGYTAHGRGICLSIDSGLLVKRMQALGWTFQNCRYSRESQLAWAEAILSRMRREALISRDTEGEKVHGFHSVLNASLSDLLQVAATIKNEAFSEEREVRFISPMISVGDERINYRVGRTALIPYVDFRLVDGDDDLRIQEIMAGPSPTQHLTQSALVGLVRRSQIGGQCNVSASQIPYREL